MYLFISLLPYLFLALIVVLALSAANKSFEMPMPVFPRRLGWALLLGITGLNLFAYESGYGIGMGLFIATLFAAVLLTFQPGRRTPAVWALSVIGIAAGLLFGLRANEFVQDVNVAVALLSLAAVLILRAVDHEDWQGLWVVHTAVRFIQRGFLHLPGFFKSLRGAKAERSSFVLVTRTVLVTLVVLVFFGALLSSADPVFDRMIAEIRDQLAGRTILSVLLLLFLAVALSIRAIEKRGAPHRLTILSFHEVFVPVAAMIGLFAVFLSVQAQYLFGSHEGLQELGLTYSEYVRKGFIELLWATFFGSLVAYVVILKQHALEDRTQVNALKAVNVLLVVALFLLLASALKRDWLYMDAYGITRVRMIGEIFLSWLTGMLLLLLTLNLVPRMREKHFLAGALTLSAAVFVTLNATNMDLRIALAEPPAGQPGDIFYASLLSTDAAAEWPGVLRTASATLDEALDTSGAPSDALKKRLADAKLASRVLADKAMDVRLGLYERRWQDYNASREAAYRMIGGGSGTALELAFTCIADEIEDWQLLRGVELADLEMARVYHYDYPFVEDDFYAIDYGSSLDAIRARKENILTPYVPVASSCALPK